LQERPEHCCTLLNHSALRSAVHQICESCDSPSCAGVNARRPEGSKEADFDAPPTQFHTTMQKLFPVLLSLACVAESVARQLFEPLIMSLVHWLTRSARRSVHRPSNPRPASVFCCMCNAFMHAPVLYHHQDHSRACWHIHVKECSQPA